MTAVADHTTAFAAVLGSRAGGDVRAEDLFVQGRATEADVLAACARITRTDIDTTQLRPFGLAFVDEFERHVLRFIRETTDVCRQTGYRDERVSRALDRRIKAATDDLLARVDDGLETVHQTYLRSAVRSAMLAVNIDTLNEHVWRGAVERLADLDAAARNRLRRSAS